MKHGKVLVFAGEDPAAALHHRMHALGSRLTPSQRESVADNLEIRECIGRGVDLSVGEWLDWMLAVGSGRRLLVVDTLTRFHGLDENDARDAKILMASLEKLAALSGAAVLYLHHVNKASAVNGLAGLQQAARGSSVLVDNARWLSFIASMTQEEAQDNGIDEANRWQYARWNVSKQNYGAGGEDRWYKRGAGGLLMPVTMPETTRGRGGKHARPLPSTSLPGFVQQASRPGVLNERW